MSAAQAGQTLRRDFGDRAELVAYLRETFPATVAVDDHVPPLEGGREAAEAALAAIDPVTYEKNRNFIDGAVTRLSPYIRHGVLDLAEVRDAALDAALDGRPGKLVQELAWRDYFRRVYAELGTAVWDDREPYKTGFAAPDYAREMPEDVLAGTTGLACVDAWRDELVTTGYLHNHARLWLAGYIVHWRRVRWQAGAHWFLQHLLDGDPASNNLSWQWVASTFSQKPYYYNRENVERFSDGRYCRDCPLYGACPMEGSYEQIEAALFPDKPPAPRPPARRKRGRKQDRGRRWHQ